ncbi:hypothetical protein OIO90_003336 [Microbotryomycetes sp. JL221]|nr:hypothetical protein OIO90_003336 [Microbotryomycetes sp. JL221]
MTTCNDDTTASSLPTTTTTTTRRPKQTSSHSQYYKFSRQPIGGRGLFVTCVRGKQHQAATETIDLIETVAAQVYPPSRLHTLEHISNQQPQQESISDHVVDDMSDTDDSIEALIEKELQQLKRQQPTSSSQQQQRRRIKPKFESVQTDTDCLLFVTTRWPYDPVELCHEMVKHVQHTGQSQTRYTQRLSPVSFTCHASSLDKIQELSTELIQQTFHDWARQNQTTTVTYQIDPQIRSHVAPLTRPILFDVLGSIVRSIVVTDKQQQQQHQQESDSTVDQDQTMTSIAQDDDQNKHQGLIEKVEANLKQPDLVLLPSVLRNVFGLSIVQGKLWSNRKFNVDVLASDARKRMNGL